MKAKQIIVLALCAVLLLGGLAAVAYPMVSSWYIANHRSEVGSSYDAAVAAEQNVLDTIRAAAVKWNRQLANGEIDPLKPEKNGYTEQLVLDGVDAMGYIEIPAISVVLPIYHGVSSTALSKGVGHMPQSSLPVGGETTHTVLSAHTGMAGNPGFSDLETLHAGDTFSLHVLGETLTYAVTQMQVVLPAEVDSVQIQAGKDLCTLVTCTPFGVNSHRLLVTGERIETATPETTQSGASSDAPRESVWLLHYRQAVLAGVGIILLALLAALVIRRRRK